MVRIVHKSVARASLAVVADVSVMVWKRRNQGISSGVCVSVMISVCLLEERRGCVLAGRRYLGI